jgi:FlaA1/EpsC-like NDP-sugar epimerase
MQVKQDRSTDLNAQRPTGAWSGAPPLILAYDTLAAVTAMFLAIVLRYRFSQYATPPGLVEYVAPALFGLTCAVLFIVMGVNRPLWRHSSLKDAVRVVQAVALAHLIFLVVLFAFTRLEDFPRTSLVMSGPLLCLFMLAPRAFAASLRSGDLRAVFRNENPAAPIAVLVGDRDRLADVLASEMRKPNGPAFRFRALIETGGGAGGRALQGVPLEGGLDRLEDTVRSLKRGGGGAAIRIVLADRPPSARLVDEAARICGRTGAALTRARRGEGVAAFTAVEAADLLARPPRALSHSRARALISGKRVLVTGAGGTIGAELVRQAASLDPDRLTLLDSAESHLYEIDRYLSQLDAAPDWRPVLGDIRDRAGMDILFAEERPDVILHAAALKHVPLMEHNAPETALTNVAGTWNIVEAAGQAGVGAVVLISTDKAVDPSSVMGATKRVAELVMMDAERRWPDTAFSSVRFGNVLASAGSVVPLFEAQIEAGGPVTVTDPETTRYFMTVEEAAGLVLEAGAQARRGEAAGALFQLDMGEPVRIAQLARQLIRLRGLAPDEDIAIEYTGLRRGEKLHEELLHAFETSIATDTPGVLQVQAPDLALEGFGQALEVLLDAARRRDAPAVRAQLQAMMPLGWPDGVSAMAPRLSVGGRT